MENEYYNFFLSSAEESVSEKSGPLNFRLKDNSALPFRNTAASAARFLSAFSKSLNSLDEELKRFESLFSNNRNSVFWASDYNDVFDILNKLIKLHKVKSVRLPKLSSSTIFRELGIKDYLADNRISLSDDGQLQFFSVDMMFSDTGSLLLLNQSNNTLSKLSNSNTNVFFTTIDRIVSSSSWAETIQQLSSYSSDGGRQDMIVFHSSPNCNNYLFIVDNQRTSLLANKELRPALSCLQCGRCSDVCSVFQTIGEKPYNNVFSGPMANITLPYLETFDTYMHVAYACTLCGRCEEVCPLSLPIRDMIVSSRHNMLCEDVLPRKQRRALNMLRRYLSNRSKLNRPALFKRYLLMHFLSADLRRSRRIPSFSIDSFNKSVRKEMSN